LIGHPRITIRTDLGTILMTDTLRPIKERKRFSINLWLALILLLTIALKTVYLYSYAKNCPFYSNLRMDSVIYLNWANIINKEGWLGKEIFYWAPLYPYLLNITLKIFHDRLLGIYLVQWVMGVCSIGLIYLIGRRVYNERAGILAAALALGYAPLTFFETKVLPTVTSVFLGLLFMVFLTRAEQEDKWLSWLMGSVALGFAIICRPNYLLVIPLMAAGLLVRSRKHLKDAVLPILTVVIIPCLIIGAITVRNYVVGNDWVIISSNAGITFAQGNNPGAHGRMTILPGFSGMVLYQRQEETRIAQDAMGRKLKVSEVNRFWFRQGLSFVQEQPSAYLRLLLDKTRMAVNSLELGSNYLLSIDKAVAPCLKLAFLPFGFIMAWAVVGLASILRERRQGLAVLTTFLSGFATLLIFYVNSRYRMALVPAAVIMAGGGVDYLLRSTWQGSIPTLFMISALMIVSLPTFMPLNRTELDRDHAGYWAVLANSYRKANKLDQALWAYDQAVGLDPHNYSYYLDKVGLLAAGGSEPKEIILWAEKTGQNITPEHMRYLFLAKSYYMVQDETRAEDHIQKLLALNIREPELYLRLGILYGNLGRDMKAREMFARGLELNPENGDLQVNYAIACFMTGDTLESMKWAEKVVEKAPYDNRARLLLEEIAKHQ
jgi:tetratricopeptide (TPR) repeat protein